MSTDRRPPPIPMSQRFAHHVDEPPTSRSNQTLQLYQTMLARFDLLTDTQRTDLVELMSLFAESAEGDRELLLALARRLAAKR